MDLDGAGDGSSDDGDDDDSDEDDSDASDLPEVRFFFWVTVLCPRSKLHHVRKYPFPTRQSSRSMTCPHAPVCFALRPSTQTVRSSNSCKRAEGASGCMLLNSAEVGRISGLGLGSQEGMDDHCSKLIRQQKLNHHNKKRHLCL